MSKFRMKLKLQALELEIEGAREDASLISRNVGQQMATLLKPVDAIIDGEVTLDKGLSLPSPPQVLNGGQRRARRRRHAEANAESVSSAVIDFVASPEKYGNPSQQWSTAEKTLWLIYVLKASGKGSEFSTRSIVETFNKHFKQSGTITTGNLNRDLGRAKTNSKPPLVGENTSREPSTWFLTDEGQKKAQTLVAKSLGETG